MQRATIPIRRAPPTSSVWLRQFHQARIDAKRLICFPHAGGSASFFVPLSEKLSPEIKVQAVQYPGRQDRILDPLIRDFARLTDEITAAVGTCDEPTAMYGHSLGAVVAFEVARRLETRGVILAHLFLSSHSVQRDLSSAPIHDLGDPELVGALRLLGGPGVELLDEPSFVDLILPMMRADLELAETYVAKAGPPLKAFITTLVGDDDAKVPIDSMTKWRSHAAGGFRSETFKGGHFYMTGDLNAVASLIASTI